MSCLGDAVRDFGHKRQNSVVESCDVSYLSPSPFPLPSREGVAKTLSPGGRGKGEGAFKPHRMPYSNAYGDFGRAVQTVR